MTCDVRDNVVRWSEPFLTRMLRGRAHPTVPGLILGFRPSADPDELIVTAGGNALDAPREYREFAGMVINAANYNAHRIVDRSFKLPAARASGGDGRREARSGGSGSTR